MCLIPAARLAVDAATGRLGVNPIETLTHETGRAALLILIATLAVTPLRRITGQNWLIRLRRPLGLFAFFYAAVHFVTYVWFDQWFALDDILADVWKRPFITVGFAAFLLLVPLAVTSTNRMMRRLGRRWSQLHRLAYLVLVLGVLHFWWLKQGKNDLAEPLVFAAVATVLLGSRLLLRWRQRRAAAGGQSRSRRSGRSSSEIVSRSRIG